jgi:hypothetical protein
MRTTPTRVSHHQKERLPRGHKERGQPCELRLASPVIICPAFTPDTQRRDYIRAVKKLAAFLGRSPDTATAEDLRAFQLHLTETGGVATNHQHDRDGAAVLLQGDARPPGDDAASGVRLSETTRPRARPSIRALPRPGTRGSAGCDSRASRLAFNLFRTDLMDTDIGWTTAPRLQAHILDFPLQDRRTGTMDTNSRAPNPTCTPLVKRNSP